jgi:GNAT superfamily N-acetyltransferase
LAPFWRNVATPLLWSAVPDADSHRSPDPLRDADFPAYRDYFIEDYAQDLASNHGMALPDAHRQADASLQQLLPLGVATPGHHLLAMVPEASNAPGEPLGYLWHAIDGAAGTTFIYDFYVTPPHRGRGLGKAAMAALEAQLAPLGIHQIKLRVAHDNRGHWRSIRRWASPSPATTWQSVWIEHLHWATTRPMAQSEMPEKT